MSRRKAEPPPPEPPPSRLVLPCSWPIGDPGEPGFRFCGEPSDPGCPYCAGHRKAAYVATPGTKK